MKTEELNDYLFSNLVMEVAGKVRARRIKQAIAARTLSEEAAKVEPQTAEDVREAMLTIRHNKRVTLELLAKIIDEGVE